MANYEQLMRLGIKKRSGQIDLSWNEIAAKCGFTTGEKARLYVKNRVKDSHIYSPDTISLDHIADESIEANNTPIHNNKCETIINANGTIVNDKLIELSQEESKTPEILMKKHGFDPTKFDLVSARNVMWNAQKEDSINTLYSSRIAVKPKEEAISLEAIEESFAKLASKYAVHNTISEPCKYNKSGKLLEVNIADLHLAKYATLATCGSDYNISIAKERFISVIDDIIAKVNMYTFEKVLFIFSNDFFNYDTTMYTTTAGTSQSYDTLWQEMFLEGCNLLVQAIEKLKQLAPVETCYIGANHDKQTSFYLICYIAAWFKNDPNVMVDISPLARKIRQFGKCLIYFLHGDIPKKQLNSIIAKEYPVEWGQSRFREIHAAHYHSEQSIIEDCGTICRFLPSVTGIDSYHYENGYTGTIMKTQSFIWDKEYGLEYIINSTIID